MNFGFFCSSLPEHSYSGVSRVADDDSGVWIKKCKMANQILRSSTQNSINSLSSCSHWSENYYWGVSEITKDGSKVIFWDDGFLTWKSGNSRLVCPGMSSSTLEIPSNEIPSNERSLIRARYRSLQRAADQPHFPHYYRIKRARIWNSSLMVWWWWVWWLLLQINLKKSVNYWKIYYSAYFFFYFEKL